MSSTPSEILKLQIIDVGTEENTWGTILNNYALKRLEQSVAGSAPITIGASNYTLNDTDYLGTESHKAVLALSGAQTASVNLIVPSRTKIYHVVNDTTDGGGGPYTVTVKTSAGAGVAVKHGRRAILHCNGTNVIEIVHSDPTAPFIKTDGSVTMAAALNMGSNKITSVTDPTADQDAATKKFVEDAITAAKAALWPVGSLYFDMTGTNPATTLGFGTWTAFAEGRFIIGVGTGTDVNGAQLTIAAGVTGGEYEHTQTIDELVPHGHPAGSSWDTGSGGATVRRFNDNGLESGLTGGGQPFNVTPPYIGAYIWRRTA